MMQVLNGSKHRGILGTVKEQMGSNLLFGGLEGETYEAERVE